MSIASLIRTVMQAIASAGKYVFRAGKWVFEKGAPIAFSVAAIPFDLAGRALGRGNGGGASDAQTRHENAITARNAEIAKDMIKRADAKKAKRLTSAEHAIAFASAIVDGSKVLPDISNLPERTQAWIALLQFDHDAARAVASASKNEIAEHIAGFKKIEGLPALPTDEWLAEARAHDLEAKRKLDAGEKLEISRKWKDFIVDDTNVKFV